MDGADTGTICMLSSHVPIERLFISRVGLMQNNSGRYGIGLHERVTATSRTWY